MSKVNKEMASEEVNSWLDAKKISSKKREVQADTIETLIDAVMEGHLTLKEDKSFDMALKFPLEGEQPLNVLNFKSRIKTETVARHLQGVKPSDVDGRLLAYVAALTSQTKALIGKLDTEDQSLAQAIAVFFV
jgi:hypothetical protein